MIGSITAIALIKTSGQIAVFGAAIVNLLAAERIRQGELTRALGTLACEIENRRLVGIECSVLQKQHEQLEKLVKV